MYNYYAILGIEMDADDRAIKSAYKQLALAYHPDRNPNNPDAEERFKQINEAYQILSNPSTRERYDQLIWWALQQSAVADEETGAQQHDQQQAPKGYTSSTTAPPEWHFQDESALSPRERRQRARKQAKAKYNDSDMGAAKAKKAEELDKDDAKGAWIAIGGMAILLLLAAVAVNVYDFITERQRNSAVEAFRARMQLANNNKDYEQSKRLVIDLMEAKNTGSNLPIYELLTELQANIRHTSNELFQTKQYEKALPFHYLWQQEIPGDSIFIESNLIECYMALNRPMPAQELIQRMMQRKATRILGYYGMAKLYDSQPDDGNQSRAYQYYDSTVRLIINDYISAHGKAYAILLEPKIQPDFHYDVFCNKARMHLKRKEYQKAESAAFWATFLKDNRPEAYIILAQAMDARGASKQEVCAEMEKGAKYGGDEAEKWMRERCK